MKIIPSLAMLLTITGCFRSALSKCRTDLATFNLDTMEGEIKYSGSSKDDDCTWKLPSSKNDDYALILYFEEITLPTFIDESITYCYGTLSIPDDMNCGISAPYCRVHTSPGSSCDANKVGPIVSERYPECSGKTYRRVEAETYIKLDSYAAESHKSFTLKYKFIRCHTTTTEYSTRDQTTRRITTTNSVKQNVTSHDVDDANSTISKGIYKPNNSEPVVLSPASDATYIIIVAVLGSLLLLACILLAISHRRNRMKNSLQDVEFSRKNNNSAFIRSNEEIMGVDSHVVIGQNQIQTDESEHAEERENVLYGFEFISSAQGHHDMDSTYAVVNKNR